MIKDEMGTWQNKSLTTLRSSELIPTAYFYAERVHEKDTFFCDFTNWIWIWFEDDFLGDSFDFYKQNMCNVAVDSMPLKLCKQNWFHTYSLSEKLKSFTVLPKRTANSFKTNKQ